MRICTHVCREDDTYLRKNREELHELKDVGESYDDVITELLEEYRERNREKLAEKMRETERMDSENLVPLDADG